MGKEEVYALSKFSKLASDWFTFVMWRSDWFITRPEKIDLVLPWRCLTLGQIHDHMSPTKQQYMDQGRSHNRNTGKSGGM